jgi:hypothetical protein
MIEDWVSFIETCAQCEENEIIRLTLSQVIGSGNVTFVLAEPLHAFGEICCCFCSMLLKYLVIIQYKIYYKGPFF